MKGRQKGYMVVSLIIVLVLFTILAAGCSKSETPPQESPAKEAPVPDATDSGRADTDVSGTTVDISSTEGAVHIDDKSGDLQVKGEEDSVSIKEDGSKTQINIEGLEGMVSIKTDEDAGTAEIKGMDGTDTSRSAKDITESDFAVKFYPGAQVEDGNITQVNHDGKEVKTSMAILHVKEDVKKVKEFYKNQFANPIVIEDGNIVSITSSPVDASIGEMSSTITIKEDKEKGVVEINILSHDAAH